MRSAIKDIVNGGGEVYLKPNGRWQVNYINGQEYLCSEIRRFEKGAEAILRAVGVEGVLWM